jgi:hypothetical protein
MRYFVWGILFLLLSCTSSVEQSLKSGDLLFVSSVISNFEQAISEVTNDEFQQNFSHVAMVNVTDSGVYVVEATSKLGVVYRTVSEFEQDNIEKTIFIGRLKSQYQQWIPNAIAHACSHLGKPYDFAFDFENDKFYCSELIYFSFANVSEKQDFFETPPMTFKTGKDADFSPFWMDYFAELNIPIPEGHPGLNPNGMSRSEKLETLKIYKTN